MNEIMTGSFFGRPSLFYVAATAATVAVCICTKVQAHCFLFDENF